MYQKGVFDAVPAHSRYLMFNLRNGADPRESLRRLANEADGEATVVGFGRGLALALNADIPGLADFPSFPKAHVSPPSTPADLWCWSRGEDPGEIARRSRALERLLAPAFERTHCLDGFKHDSGRDLSGYEDGTENPEGDEALRAAFLAEAAPALDGSTFLATQVWKHDLDHFESLSATERDHVIGRRVTDNAELEDAPESAHVKRTEQESFSPEAIVLRRSMPWANAEGEGLNFLAFGRDFSAFEAQLNRMVGAEDGIVDALFRFSRPITGNYFWCPPTRDGGLNLSQLGL